MELLCRRVETPLFELLTAKVTGQLLQFTLAVVNFILNIAVTGEAMHSGVSEKTNKPQICSGVEALLTLQPVLNGVIVSKGRNLPFELPPLTARADSYSSLPTNKPQIWSGVEALLTLQPVLNRVIVSKKDVTPPFEIPLLTATGQLLQFTLVAVNFILNIAVTGEAMHSGVNAKSGLASVVFLPKRVQAWIGYT
ncbi:hypothetical protein CEXT_664751 [Caerostris extrusa]|uniref:Uncharacterized protein n=1 Tax=Caerostris extrusa TaxID=172846 RepID=A0AAV4S8E2_CAEEX|nr:hypothetical protein CEXT_664751 [Caerostris extrusa]